MVVCPCIHNVCCQTLHVYARGYHPPFCTPTHLHPPSLPVIRFGVAQRQRLLESGPIQPHVLYMSATPIPRTLALVELGEMDVSSIKELPPHRQPITTTVLKNTKAGQAQAEAAVLQELDGGGQAYMVFPLIETSEKPTMKHLTSMVDAYEYYMVHIIIIVVVVIIVIIIIIISSSSI